MRHSSVYACHCSSGLRRRAALDEICPVRQNGIELLSIQKFHLDELMRGVALNCGTQYDKQVKEVTTVQGWDAWNDPMAKRGIEKITPPDVIATDSDEFVEYDDDDDQDEQDANQDAPDQKAP